MENQIKVWDKIAPEWDEYKKIPPKHLVEFLKEAKGNVLDLGSGSGRNMIPIKGTWYLSDFSSEMISLAKKRAEKQGIKAEFSVNSMEDLPYEDNFFSYAVCISSLHCVKGEKNRKKAVEELFRVMKKGGKARIGVWNRMSKRFNNKSSEKMIGWTDKGKRYYYLFTEEEVHKLFESVGFKIIDTLNSEMMINFTVIKED
jgi:tRNA (uracil-5-)-methyltransferase TRM9